MSGAVACKIIKRYILRNSPPQQHSGASTLIRGLLRQICDSPYNDRDLAICANLPTPLIPLRKGGGILKVSIHANPKKSHANPHKIRASFTSQKQIHHKFTPQSQILKFPRSATASRIFRATCIYAVVAFLIVCIATHIDK